MSEQRQYDRDVTLAEARCVVLRMKDKRVIYGDVVRRPEGGAFRIRLWGCGQRTLLVRVDDVHSADAAYGLSAAQVRTIEGRQSNRVFIGAKAPVPGKANGDE